MWKKSKLKCEMIWKSIVHIKSFANLEYVRKYYFPKDIGRKASSKRYGNIWEKSIELNP